MNRPVPTETSSAPSSRVACKSVDAFTVVGLILVALVAAALRLWQIQDPLWVDELHTAWVVDGDLSDLFGRARRGNQSGVYFLTVWMTTRLAGLSEWTLRLPSLVAGILLVPTVGYLVWCWTGSRFAALMAACCIAVDRQMIFYGQEARVYALVQLFSVIHIALFTRILAKPTLAYRLTFIAIGILLFYLHYTAMLLLSAELGAVIFLHATARSRPLYRLRDLGIDATLILLGCLGPSLGHLREIAGRRENWSQFVDAVPDANMIYPFYSYLVIPGIWLTGMLVLRRMRGLPWRFRYDPSSWRHGCIVASWLCLPPLCAWVLTVSSTAPLFLYRYLVVSSIAMVVVASLVSCYETRRIPRWALLLAVIGVSIMGSRMIPQLLADGRLLPDRDENWREAVAYLNAAQLDGQPLLVRSGLIEADQLRFSDDPSLREFCLLPVRAIYRLDLPDHQSLIPLTRKNAGDVSSATKLQLLQAGGGWLLLRGTVVTRRQVEAQLLESLPQEWQVDERRSFGGNLHFLHVAGIQPGK